MGDAAIDEVVAWAMPRALKKSLKSIQETGPLRALKEAFPVRRGVLLAAFERSGFDFDKLLMKDVELKHRMPDRPEAWG